MKIKLPPNRSHRNRRWFGIPAFVCLSLIPQYAVADAGDTLNVTVGSTFMYDSNLFRLSNTIPSSIVGSDRKSDQIITTTATLSLNKFYSMQRFEVNGSLVDNRYHTFNYLDFLAKNGTAIWHWSLTPYFYGRLTGNHREALNNFADLTGLANSIDTRNIRTENNVRYDGVFELDGAWRLVGGVAYDVRTNSRPLVQDFDNLVLSVEGGLRYAFPSGSSLTYKARAGFGEFFKREQPIASQLFDTRFNEMEHEMRLVWPMTAKTSIEGRVGHLSRTHPHFAERNFNGFVGHFNVNWDVTARTRVVAGWARDLLNFQLAPGTFAGSPFFQTFSASYVAAHRIFFAPVWQITDRTTLRLRYDYTLRDHLGAVESLPGGDRTDMTHSGLVALDWQAHRALFISGALQRDHRSSDHRGFNFDSASASISARLNF